MKTILVVDDEADITEALQLYLELDGYETIPAYDGTEALSKAVEARPDLILTDITMPGLDGAELIERIRATPALRDTPIIAMSGKRRPALAIPFFRKPFDPADLVAEIARLLAPAE